MTKRVWILGAGFSRPLGGPLLPDLLSMRRWRDLLAKYEWLFDPLESKEPQEILPAVVAVYLLYHWGRDFPEGSLFGEPPSRRGEKHFEHAEDFLVRLETMGEGQIRNLLQAASRAMEHYTAEDAGGLGETLERVPRLHYAVELEWPFLMRVTQEQLLRAARLLLALECEEFTKKDWRTFEEFTPYADWADRLTLGDTIVTFNYDRVVEEALGERCCVPRGSGTDERKIPVFKMHGSTDWTLENSSITRRKTPDLDGQPPPFIAIPGRSKSTDTDHLSELWGRVHFEITQAEEVNIVGYGMPESDAKARKFLLTGC